MSKDWTDQILDSQIAEACREHSDLFDRVRRRTQSNLHAWVVVQDLIRRFPPKRKDNKGKPLYEGQLDLLRGLGIRNLSDLAWKQAVVLTDCVLAERRGSEPY